MANNRRRNYEDQNARISILARAPRLETGYVSADCSAKAQNHLQRGGPYVPDTPWKRAKEGNPAPDLPDRKARKRGGKAAKPGLSHELVPVLVAADRSGATVSAVLPAVSAAHLQAALAPVLDKDALLVTDGCTSYPPCAAALGVSHEVLNQSAGERVRGELHMRPSTADTPS